ncbi:hypothetical protein CVIRNUC_009538 [Coccomyxa viridis]|uniref:Cyclin N-terminal domain-containing protein n=1 Tax=Coccomyxa viridis TaxID=1274662 RepID=A0AAV1IIR8_9CHLO|nr:hypothetical protein CVIRNUC_009538 [Coccomyxa viridis]
MQPPPVSAPPAQFEGSPPATLPEGHVCPGMLASFRKRKSSNALQEQWKQQGFPQAERGALGGKPIPRTLSVEESGRSSATLGTASAEEWLQQAARDGENDGDSPASRLQYQLMQGQAHRSSEDHKRRRVSSITPEALGVAAACPAQPLTSEQRIGGATPECLDRQSAVASIEDARSQQTECRAQGQLSAQDEQLSSSEDPDSSPDSCFDSAFIPAIKTGPAQQGANAAGPAEVPPAPVLVSAQQQLHGGKVYRFGSLRSRSRLSMTDSAAMQQPAVPGTLPCQAPPQVLQPCANLAPCAVASQLLASRPAGPVQAAPVQVAVAQTGNPTMAVANLIAGHSLARLPPAELALLIANHNGSDPALTQALQCAMSALSDAQLGNVGLALQELNRVLRGPKTQQQPVQKQIPVQRAAVPTVCRLQPGCQHPAQFNDRVAPAAKGGAAPMVRIGRPVLPAQAQMQLELCRQLQDGHCSLVASQRISWLQVLTMWSKGTDMVQADTPAFALHLWTRVQPLVCVRRVAQSGACKPWETVALACLWVAAKHEEARRALPPASRLAPLASCNARVLCAVEIHVLELLKWAPLALWDDALHSKGIRFRQ